MFSQVKSVIRKRVGQTDLFLIIYSHQRPLVNRQRKPENASIIKAVDHRTDTVPNLGKTLAFSKQKHERN